MVGAGPAGSFLNLILARYGLGEGVLCIDANAGPTPAGHADGITPRTVEALSSFDLETDVLKHGVHVVERVNWNRRPTTETNEPAQLVRDFRMRMSFPTNGRYNDGLFYGMHQGHMERVFADDLALYSTRTVQRNTRLVSVEIDPSDVDYPVLACVTTSDSADSVQVRAKYLVGADGAHSAVRRSLGIKMKGDTTDDMYGVIDLVPETDYPDIRCAGNIRSGDETLLHVPREARADGHHLVRLYVPLDNVETNGEVSNDEPSNDQNADLRPYSHTQSRTHATQHTAAIILAKANRMMAPYTIKPHPDSPEISWSTAYRVGQRLAAHQQWPPVPAHPRIFLIGDASHTHSPKIGQGMNVSMLDAHNLAWKLTHVLSGLVPTASIADVLHSYEAERRPVASDLINIDKLWYSARYAKVREAIQRDEAKQPHPQQNGEVQDRKGAPADLPLHEQVLQGEILDFISGLSTEHAATASSLIGNGPRDKKQAPLKDAAEMAAVKAGKLRIGRRLPEAQCMRFADGIYKYLQTEVVKGSGCWWVVIFAARDFGDETDGRSACVAQQILDLSHDYAQDMISSVILHCKAQWGFEWTDLPKQIKRECEMRLLGFEDAEASYARFGVGVEDGAIVLVRPDGVLAMLEELTGDAVQRVDNFLARVLVKR